MVKEKITKELNKMRRSLKKNERDGVYPLIDTIDDVLAHNDDITLQSICIISELLKNIIYTVDNTKVHKIIVNILVLLIREMKDMKDKRQLIPVNTQLRLDKTMIALDIFIANLIERIGGY